MKKLLRLGMFVMMFVAMPMSSFAGSPIMEMPDGARIKTVIDGKWAFVHVTGMDAKKKLLYTNVE